MNAFKLAIFSALVAGGLALGVPEQATAGGFYFGVGNGGFYGPGYGYGGQRYGYGGFNRGYGYGGGYGYNRGYSNRGYRRYSDDDDGWRGNRYNYGNNYGYGRGFGRYNNDDDD